MVERTDLRSLLSVSIRIIMSQAKICSSRLLEEGSEDLSDAPMKGLRDPLLEKKINYSNTV